MNLFSKYNLMQLLIMKNSEAHQLGCKKPTNLPLSQHGRLTINKLHSHFQFKFQHLYLHCILIFFTVNL